VRPSVHDRRRFLQGATIASGIALTARSFADRPPARPRGGASTVPRVVVAQADERITVMPGAGIVPDNLAALRELTRAREFHASATRRLPSPMRHAPANPLGMDAGETRTDAETVRALVAVLGASAGDEQPRCTSCDVPRHPVPGR